MIDLLAQTADSAPSWIDALAKLGVAGALMVLLWFLLVKYVPSIEKRHETERAEWRTERDEWRQYLKERDNQFHEMMEAVESICRDIQRQNVRVLEMIQRHERSP